MNRTAFFAAVRSAPFAGSLAQGQVDGLNAILDEWEKRKLSDIRWLAYMLATVFHETFIPPYGVAGRSMQPVRETGRGRGMRYGTTYYGRGFVQLTWEANYRKASAVVGVDLVAHPDRALDLPIAAAILFDGMIKGWFTGHKLADYFGATLSDDVGARRIINGTDRAVLIAGYATAFAKALATAAAAPDTVGGRDVPAVIIPAIVTPPPPDNPEVETTPAKLPVSSASKAAGAAGAIATAAAAHAAGLSWGWIVIVVAAALVVGGIVFMARKGH